MLCRHCQVKKANRPRGLCWSCYYRPGVRDLYQSESKFGQRNEPTQVEVDAMIAENLPTMPENGRREKRPKKWRPPKIKFKMRNPYWW